MKRSREHASRSTRLKNWLVGDCENGEEVQIYGQKMISQVYSSKPPVIALHNFCSKEEAAAIIHTTKNKLFRRSEVGAGVHGIRTSESAEVQPTDSAELLDVCRRIMCFSDQPNTIVQLVVVRYEPGQEFGLHHDGEFRRYTFLLYLNEEPHDAASPTASPTRVSTAPKCLPPPSATVPPELCEEAKKSTDRAASHGETFFPELRVKIRPKTGTAILWRNNMIDAHGNVSPDLRMLHAGLPPFGATKYVLNCWVLEESSLVD